MSASLLSRRTVNPWVFFAGLLLLAAEISALVSDHSFLWRAPESPIHRLLLAKIESVNGSVRVRSPHFFAWVKASKDQALFEGDQIATLEGSSAALRFTNGKTATIGANSRISLNSSQDTSGNNVGISLLAGTGVAEEPAVKAPKPVIERLIELGPTLTPAQIPVDYVSNVEALRPRLEKLEKIQGNTVSVLRWSCPNGAELIQSKIEISSSETFDNPVVSQVSPQPCSFRFQPPKKGVYFWRVTRVLEKNPMTSAVDSFEAVIELAAPSLSRPKIERGPATEAPKIEAPQLAPPRIRYQTKPKERQSLRLTPLWRLFGALVESLLDFAATSAEAAEKSPAPPSEKAQSKAEQAFSVHLDWRSVANAKAYVLQISPDANFEKPVAEKYLVSPKYEWQTSIPGRYFWRVAGIDQEGDRGPFSEFNTFTILSERNIPNVESTFDTYLRFDEYQTKRQTVGVTLGGSFSRYDFSSTDTANSPASVQFQTKTAYQVGLRYEYRLSQYYSLHASLNTEQKTISAGDFVNRPQQNTMKMNETVLSLAVTKRYFYPSYFLSLTPGLRFSFIDIPIKESNSQLTLGEFDFIGMFVTGGFHKYLARTWLFSTHFGGVFQYTDNSIRYGPRGSLDLSKEIDETWSIALGFSFEYRFYNFNADNLSGSAKSLILRPNLSVGFSF